MQSNNMTSNNLISEHGPETKYEFIFYLHKRYTGFVILKANDIYLSGQNLLSLIIIHCSIWTLRIIFIHITQLVNNLNVLKF